MDVKVDVQKALLAYQTVIEAGEAEGVYYHYQGLTAERDFDGYTLCLTDGRVTLWVYFHQRFELEYRHRRDAESFLRKIDALLTSH